MQGICDQSVANVAEQLGFVQILNLLCHWFQQANLQALEE
jgi:hypothetical protein